ncbi:MAG: Uma2 family endonuclease [Phormidesmis sp. CAN_BIN44]|nr:Uma2 family endonuclease [Phormidesmis sp. CAN_BIN44]
MVTTPVATDLNILSLDDWMHNPPPGKEWIDGQLVDKHPSIWIEGHSIETNGMTLKHSRTQAILATCWKNYSAQNNLGGEVYTEAPCLTHKKGRYLDVAYLTPELLTQFGQEDVLPQSFPLCAEVISPADFAQDVVAKAQEYLQSGGEEVWLLFPENRWVIVVTQDAQKIFVSGKVVGTQKILIGFSIAVDDLLP